MTRSRLGAMLLLIAAFVLGGLLGGAITSVADRRAHEKSHRQGPRPGYVERLSQDLDLTADQRERIQAVLDRHQPAMDSLWAQMRPQFESERQVIRQEIVALLTPEQQAKYAAIVQRQDSLRRAGQERNRNVRP